MFIFTTLIRFIKVRAKKRALILHASRFGKVIATRFHSALFFTTRPYDFNKKEKTNGHFSERFS